MNDFVERVVREATGASGTATTTHLQTLWSGYGAILRWQAEGAPPVIVKQVRLGAAQGHPRGWHTNQSHQRKERSYEVEQAFYRDYAKRCDAACRVPDCLASERDGDEIVMVLEDLDAAGFPGRRSSLSDAELRACLQWLAEFHATFLGAEPSRLWPIGTYWHLATRPDELAAMTEAHLRQAAPAIDARLNGARFQTLVHGDAKVANFCFGEGGQVAAVDFQYVGGGCGIKDVAYFVSSCLNDAECERRESELLDCYFSQLKSAMTARGKSGFAEVEHEWRALYSVAWADFYRFLCGWSPGHWKMHGYSERLTNAVIAALDAD